MISLLLTFLMAGNSFADERSLQAAVAAFRSAKTAAQKERILSRLSAADEKAFLRNPHLSVSELSGVSDSLLEEILHRNPEIPLHPVVIGAIKDDLRIQLAFMGRPLPNDDLMEKVPIDVRERLKRLKFEQVASAAKSADVLEGGCAAFLRATAEGRPGGVKES